MERLGATTMRGNPLTLLGPELKAGEKAPDFNAVNDSLQPVNAGVDECSPLTESFSV